MKLDEIDNMMDDVIGAVQQLETDVLKIDVCPDDPQYLEAKIANVQVGDISTYQHLQPVVKLLNQRWWIPVFRRNGNMTGDMYTCVSVTGNFTPAYA